MLLGFFLICFFASVIGAICGIGGGVIIKPVLDAFGILDVRTISFLSGTTVLAMTSYSVLCSKFGGKSLVSRKIGLPLAVGAACGGILGQVLFQYILTLSANKDRVGAVQAFCLLLVTLGTLLYTLYKDQISAHRVKRMSYCFSIGIFLGVVSSFLGIGGGPINLVALFFFFSMPVKAAVENSLYTIFFSQMASLMQSVFMHSIPDFVPGILAVMVFGGLLGGFFGRRLNKKLQEETIEHLFIALMIAMLFINLYDINKFVQ